MKHILFVVFLSFAFRMTFCQTGIDIENLYQLRVQDPDSLANAQHLKSIKIYSTKAKSSPKLKSEKYFDAGGYLIRLVKIDEFYLKDTCNISINHYPGGLIFVNTKINRKALERIKSADNEWFQYKSYRDHSTSHNKYFSLNTVYHFRRDSTFGIVTFIDGVKFDSINHRHFLAGLNSSSTEVHASIDSVYNSDTLVLIQQELFGDQKTVARRYFLKGYEHPIKAEVLKFRNDSLLYNRYNTWQYDNKKRLVLYKEIQDTTVFVTEATSYNETTGSKMVMIDAYPSDNRIDKIWVYDSANRMIESVKFVSDYSIKEAKFNIIKYSTFYYYNDKGMIQTESNYTNDQLKETISYRYSYFPPTVTPAQKTSDH